MMQKLLPFLSLMVLFVALAIASPHASSKSRLGPFGAGPISAASASVAYGSGARPSAEHTTTGRSPRRTASTTRDAATSRSASVASDVPPNFCTITFMPARTGLG